MTDYESIAKEQHKVLESLVQFIKTHRLSITSGMTKRELELLMDELHSCNAVILKAKRLES